MPVRNNIKKVLVIGSGPIVIGQAAEFDYAGSQVCRALKSAGLTVLLVNSNPATIMTDKAMADEVFIEPLTQAVLERIIAERRPDSILSTLGGQTALNLCMELARSGFLKRHGVKLLGADPATIDKAEDRQLFKDMLARIGQPVIPGEVVTDLDAALAFAARIGYPVIVRPAYTLGGTGGGIAASEAELRRIGESGLSLSPIHQILVERSIAGWKEIEFELMRDAADNVITVCCMENLDPVGVHTGDSIVVAPSLTLADKEYQMLRTAAIDIIRALGIEGGCNCQFALNPDSFEYAVIEVNPRVSRSSALASKATGYPIAKVAGLIAVGYTLPELTNSITGKTCACFEPALDYVVVKLPRFPFDKFVYARRTLGTQMKATGEVMAIGTSFEHALMKAVRCIELGLTDLNLKKLAGKTKEELERRLAMCDDERLFVVYAALKAGIPAERIHKITRIDSFFVEKLAGLMQMERTLASGPLMPELYRRAKRMGFLDQTIRALSGTEPPCRLRPAYRMVDTCAAEFDAETPYFYAAWEGENEAAEFLRAHPSGKKKAIVFGSGPIRIGQGVEFDYCSVHCVSQLKKSGWEAVLVNNNPETVSTDFDVSDRLYFEPLTPEDVDGILDTEQPDGAVVQFGGQTAIKLTKHLAARGIPILGTQPDAIDAAEDRERFDALLERCGIPRPNGETAFNTEKALRCAADVGYPVLLRPSYVLGGQNMIIAYSDADVKEYMGIITGGGQLENPVLIDKYLVGTELEVDAVCDGTDFLIPGIMEHIERAGIHSGDSISVYPPQTLSAEVQQTVVEYTGRLAKALGAVGLMNVQYVLHEGCLYVIEVNPRSSRTVPYISKVTGVPAVDLATRVTLGETLAQLGYGSGLWPVGKRVAVKVPVFSFPKLRDADSHLGPEMKSTGEVLGIDESFENALYKGLLAAGYELHKVGDTVLITVRDSDKPEAPALAQKFIDFGYKICATPGTAAYLTAHGIPARSVKLSDEDLRSMTRLFDSGAVDFVVSTSKTGRKPAVLSVQLRSRAIERNIATLTSIDTANALANCLLAGTTMADVNMVDICKL